MAHLVPHFLFVYKALRVLISDLSLIKLESREMGFTANSKNVYINITVNEETLYINCKLLDPRPLVKMEIV